MPRVCLEWVEVDGLTTWRLVMRYPSCVTKKPEPEPALVCTVTTDRVASSIGEAGLNRLRNSILQITLALVPPAELVTLVFVLPLGRLVGEVPFAVLVLVLVDTRLDRGQDRDQTEQNQP